MNNPPNAENWVKRVDLLYGIGFLHDNHDQTGIYTSIQLHGMLSPKTATRVSLWENALGAFFSFLETELDTHFVVSVIAIFPNAAVRNVSFRCRDGAARNKKELDRAVVDLMDKMAGEFGTTDTMLRMRAELKGYV